MANTDTASGKIAVVENPIFKLVVQAAVPVLLGILVTLAVSINDAQKEQGKQLNTLGGQMGVMVQQNSDYVGRLTKVEADLSNLNQDHAALKGRVLVLESLRRK